MALRATMFSLPYFRGTGTLSAIDGCFHYPGDGYLSIVLVVVIQAFRGHLQLLVANL